MNTEEIKSFFATMKDESDRACAILGATLLDEECKNILKKIIQHKKVFDDGKAMR